MKQRPEVCLLAKFPRGRSLFLSLCLYVIQYIFCRRNFSLKTFFYILSIHIAAWLTPISSVTVKQAVGWAWQWCIMSHLIHIGQIYLKTATAVIRAVGMEEIPLIHYHFMMLIASMSWSSHGRLIKKTRCIINHLERYGLPTYPSDCGINVEMVLKFHNIIFQIGQPKTTQMSYDFYFYFCLNGCNFTTISTCTSLSTLTTPRDLWMPASANFVIGFTSWNKSTTQFPSW